MNAQRVDATFASRTERSERLRGHVSEKGERSPQARRSFSWLGLLALTLVSCTAPEGPVITYFGADPMIAGAGATVILSWSVLGADELRLAPTGIDVTGADSYVVRPTTSTTYTLTAENDQGTSSATVTVTVEDLAVIEAFIVEGDPVNPGLPASLSWVVTNAESLWLLEPGSDERIDVFGTTVFALEATRPGPYTLIAGAPDGEVEAQVHPARAVPAFTALVAGQSNAQGVNFLDPLDALAFIAATEGVQMLGNDYVWKPAYEPLDDCVGQVDVVSADPEGGCEQFDENTSGVSFGVSLGNSLTAVNGGEVFLIPAARGGSALTGSNVWAVGDAADAGTLYGSAIIRARLAETEQAAPIGHEFDGAHYGAMVWYQGESDTTSTAETDDFSERTDAVLDGFQAELAAPVVLVQLSRRGWTGTGDVGDRNLLYQRVREAQRALATGSRTPAGAPSPAARADTYLVVTHDLPMADGRHLSAAGQVELGRRVALAVREHLWGEAVDGSGPRLERVLQTSDTVLEIRTDRALTPPATTGPGAYDGYFAVFSAGQAVLVSSVALKEGDPSVIRIALAEPAPTAEVRYMPPPGTITGFVGDVVRSASCSEPRPGTNQCLPMPAFGAVAEAETMQRLETYFEVEPMD